MKTYVNNLDLTTRLKPKDSFFGGRTNALKLHHKVNENERIKYADFTSLYTYVNKYKQYPVGHPIIITKDFKTIDQYFGIAKLKILPPRQLYLPVLPVRCHNKLTFPLCRTCNENKTQTICVCSDVERTLMGTWCIPEILIALEKKYTIIKIYEVYHFEQTSTHLFEEYVNTFLRFKQESSNWPVECTSEETKRKYVADYFKHEGIVLKKITHNPGLRCLAKLMLNSLWGKYGQRQKFNQTIYFT